MKVIIKKVLGFMLLACVAVGALITGVVLTRTNYSALAEGEPSQLTLKINDETGNDVTLVQGQEFTLTVTITTTHTEPWTSAYIHVGILNAAADAMDTTYYNKISYVAGSAETDFIDEDTANYDLIVLYTKQDGLRISLGRGSDGESVSGSVSLVVTLKMKVADDFPKDTPVPFGMTLLKGNRVEFNEGSISDNAKENTLVANTLNLIVREASEDNTLKDLEVGHDSGALTSLAVPGDAEGDPAVVPDTSDYTFNFNDLTSFYVKPTANDENAKIGVALNQQVTYTDVTSGNSETLTLVDPSTLTDGDHNMLYVQVTAENGVAKTYSVTVKIGYVRLNSITASASTPTSGVTKNGLDLSATSDVYDKDTFAYDVFVPSDYDTDGGSVTLNASVLTGYDASTTIALSGTGCDPMQLDGATATSQLTSGGTVLLKNIVFPVNDGDAKPTLTLTATASDGVTTQVYTLTFIKVSVDADLNTITVTGVETSNTFANDATQATANGVDYYYLLIGETGKQASVAIAAKHDAATIAVGWTDGTITETLPAYANPTTYGEGEYTITITAEAGNTKTYTFTLAAALYLKLADDSKYMFLKEEIVDDDGEMLYYRRAYPEVTLDDGATLEHGVSDLDFERVVLGQILPETTVNQLVNNILSSQLSDIRIYTHRDELIYDCLQPGEDFTEDDLDDADSYPVGTGWRIEYGEEGNADVVYISVLGDVTGDGRITSADTSRINAYIRETDVGLSTFTVLEYRLAAYVMNRGQIYSGDTSAINSIIREVRSIDYYYYNPETV